MPAVRARCMRAIESTLSGPPKSPAAAKVKWVAVSSFHRGGLTWIGVSVGELYSTRATAVATKRRTTTSAVAFLPGNGRARGALRGGRLGPVSSRFGVRRRSGVCLFQGDPGSPPPGVVTAFPRTDSRTVRTGAYQGLVAGALSGAIGLATTGATCVTVVF